LKLHEKIALCQRAVEHARRSGDENAIAASLTELGVAFKYAGQSENSFVSHQEALAHAAGAQPLVRSRVHAASAAAFAQRQVADEFLRHIHLAHEVLPVRPELEPHTLSADYGFHLLAFYEGVAYMSLGKPGDALRTFNEFELDPSAQHTPLRNRLEVVNQQGRAAIMSNDIEMYVRFLEAGISGAIAIGSRKRFDEAMSICRDNVPADWLRDRRVRSILEPFNARGQT
jgi:hypothetical protein